jgi:hypothetical protein
VVSRADVFSSEDLQSGQTEDLEVEPEAPVIHVPHVVFEPLLPGHRVPSVHLGPPRDPGPHVVPTGLLGRVQREVLDPERAGSDQAHVPLQHVEQLGQLVQAGGPEEPADPADTGSIGQRLAFRITEVVHGTELVDAEDPAVQPRSVLHEQHGPAHREPYHQGDHEEEGQQEGQRDRGKDDVQSPLDRPAHREATGRDLGPRARFGCPSGPSSER